MIVGKRKNYTMLLERFNRQITIKTAHGFTFSQNKRVTTGILNAQKKPPKFGWLLKFD